MVARAAIVDSVFGAIDELNPQLEQRQQVVKDEATKLFGNGSTLDSLGLVNLILAVEQRISDDFEAAVTLADERAMSRRNSPFRSVESLIDYIEELLQEPSSE